MAFVLDASAALALAFPDEGADDATVGAVEGRLRREQAWVPAVWHLEVGNALLVAVRSGRIDEAVAREALDLLSALPVEAAGGSPWAALRAAWSLARTHGLTTYDAAYLALAMERGVPLATLDRRLRRAARAAGVPLL